MTKISVEKTICGGDSGSPLLRKVGDSWFYIGAQSSSNGAGCTKVCDVLCVATQGLAISNISIINEAFTYVGSPGIGQGTTGKESGSTGETTPNSTSSKAPAKKKITITCVKGKLTTKVIGTSPKCPAGYKKK